MKSYLSLLVLLILSFSSLAKKVMFQVDMTGVPVNVTGMHISGDLQLAAGYGGNNFDCNIMTMTANANDTNLYQLLVDIPAFQKYEYKFVNGDQCYEVEFVPVESRANYNFSDSRWIYIDSIANDTTYLAPVRFAQNAPQNLTLVRFKVNMQNVASLSPSGVHTAGNFQSWNPGINRLYSFANNVYEWIAYVDTGNYTFRYYNGNTAIDGESVPTGCADINGDRYLYVTHDTVMDVLCYATCTQCWATATNELIDAHSTSFFPNPNQGIFQLNAPNYGHLQMMDITGRIVFTQPVKPGQQQIITTSLLTGIYQLRVVYENGTAYHSKLIIQ